MTTADQFTRDFTFARDLIRDNKLPAWWNNLLRALHKFSDFNTGAGDTSWSGLQIELAKDGLMASRDTLRHAFRRLEELGLVYRDREKNIDLMRLVYTVRTSVTQAVGDCMTAVAKKVEAVGIKLKKRLEAARKRLEEQRQRRRIHRVHSQGLTEEKPTSGAPCESTAVSKVPFGDPYSKGKPSKNEIGARELADYLAGRTKSLTPLALQAMYAAA